MQLIKIFHRIEFCPWTGRRGARSVGTSPQRTPSGVVWHWMHVSVGYTHFVIEWNGPTKLTQVYMRKIWIASHCDQQQPLRAFPATASFSSRILTRNTPVALFLPALLDAVNGCL